MKTEKLHLHRVFLILSYTYLTCVFLNADVVHGELTINDPYLGPYTDVYPYIDIRQDQLSCSASANGTCPLYIALMVSFGGEFNSSGVIPGVQLALDQINNDPTMLPGYTLHYTLKETVCESHGTVALDALHTELFQSPTKLGVIGSGCSLATEPTAQVSHYYNVTHVSCASSSTSLADRERFRYYFQLLATEADLSIGFYSIIKKFGWKRVAIILQEESLFEVTMNHLQQLLPNDTKVQVFRFSTRNGISDLGAQPFNPEYRVFLFAMFSLHARRLLCEAAIRGIHYPRHEFLFYGWYADNWWREEDAELQSLYNNRCSIADRERVIGPALSPLQNEFISNCSNDADSGINGFNFQRRYEELLNLTTSSRVQLSDQSIYSQQCYDATWTLARALNNTLNDVAASSDLSARLREYEPNLPSSVDFGLQHFSYNNSGFVDVVFGHLNRTNFSGITGDVYFNTSTGVRIVPKTVIFQYRTSNTAECTSCSCSKMPQEKPTIGREIIAEVNINELNFNLLIDEDLLWTDGVPYDGEPEPRIVTVHVALTVICSLLAVSGIIFAIFCIVFNFLNREKKLIRLTSPNLNYLIGAGAIVLYISVCFYVIPTDNQLAATVFCNLTPWLTAIGYSLCYGTIVAKMFRVFYIFRNPTAKKRRVQDWMLILAVMVFVVLDIVILLVYTIVEGARGNLNAERTVHEENRQIEVGPTGIIVQFFFYLCNSQSRDIALGVLYGYKAVLQVAALVFSFSIRKVKVKGVNDAKYVAAAVYVTSIVTAVIFVSLYSLKTFVNLYAALFSLGFFIGTSVILVLVFIPKMISLHRDPEGEKVFSKTSPGLSHVSMQGSKELSKENERIIETLRSRVKELETSLQQDRKLELSSESYNGMDERKCSVTFSETMVIKNGHRSFTSSIDGNLDNVVKDSDALKL